jgi:hypothetical protein
VPDLDSTMNPQIDDSDSFLYLTPVADNEDDALMDFVQYLVM